MATARNTKIVQPRCQDEIRHLLGLKKGLKTMAYLASLAAPDAGLFRAIAHRFSAGSLRRGPPRIGNARVEMIDDRSSVEHSGPPRAKSPAAACVEGDIDHSANGLTKKTAELKIQNTIVISEEDRFLQNPTGITHRDPLPDSQVFQVRRIHTAPTSTSCTLDASNGGLRSTWRLKRRQALSSRLNPAFTNVSGAFWQSRQIFASD